MTENGPNAAGVEAFFDNQKLTVQVTLKRGVFFVSTVDFILPPKKWCHLVITHSVPGTFSSGGELKVCVVCCFSFVCDLCLVLLCSWVALMVNI